MTLAWLRNYDDPIFMFINKQHCNTQKNNVERALSEWDIAPDSIKIACCQAIRSMFNTPIIMDWPSKEANQKNELIKQKNLFFC
jgi:hypothetical protein